MANPMTDLMDNHMTDPMTDLIIMTVSMTFLTVSMTLLGCFIRISDSSP